MGVGRAGERGLGRQAVYSTVAVTGAVGRLGRTLDGAQTLYSIRRCDAGAERSEAMR